MKGLYRYLSPFSPDQSGAVAVLYELGGIIVILDAGGCAGNICGFDEPRWGHKQSAVYSAGIRDLDAILGRDERTIDKIGSAVEAVGDANFIALIGTPVPAVVGTDLKALARMCEKKFGLPTIAIETYGMGYYDTGAELAYMTLIKAIEKEQLVPPKDQKDAHSVGVLGATPLDLLSLDGAELIRQRVEVKTTQQLLLEERMRTGEVTSPFRHMVRETYENNKPAIYVFGVDCGFENLSHLFTVDKNVVVSPAGLKPARYLEEHYGIPFEVSYPIGHELTVDLHDRFCAVYRALGEERPVKALVLHQQVLGNSLREAVEGLNEAHRTLNAFDAGNPDAEVRSVCEFNLRVGTFFLQDKGLAREEDRKFEGEDQFIAYLKEENFDVILGDPMYKMALKWWDGTFLSLPQYSVSGEAHEAQSEKDIMN